MPQYESLLCISPARCQYIPRLRNVHLHFVDEAVCENLSGFEKTIDESERIAHLPNSDDSHTYDRINYVSGLKCPASTVNFVEVDLLVEKCTKIINFIFTKIGRYSIMFPKFIYCFYSYYVNDLGAGAFELPFPLW